MSLQHAVRGPGFQGTGGLDTPGEVLTVGFVLCLWHSCQLMSYNAKSGACLIVLCRIFLEPADDTDKVLFFSFCILNITPELIEV
jgi:hypothetical protein